MLRQSLSLLLNPVLHRNLRKMSKIAVCQLTGVQDKLKNLETIEELVQNACKTNDIKFVFFPEAADYVAASAKESIAMAEELTGNIMTQYKKCAEKNNVWMSIGGFHEKNVEDPTVRIFNSHVIINNLGEIVSIYRKVHLFDVKIPEKNINLQESTYVSSGDKIVLPVETPIGKLGLSICYDVRFPEISTCLRKMGAEILTYPSAFTTTTGQAHWESLLKARAIENQCYVIAAAQYGTHNEKRQSYGQSLVVSPWGEIIAQCASYPPGNTDKPKTDASFAIATIDLEQLNKIRTEMPVFNHRRNDVYSLTPIRLGCSYNKENAKCVDDETFMFANKPIPGTTVFCKTELAFAFTNIRCVVPGHVLVSSLRVARRLSDLTPEEVSELFQMVVKVQKAMESEHKCDSSTICVQDGIDSGQTVPHVHVHILPRRKGDFARNDDIYEQLAKHDRDLNPEPIRSLEEMSDEARKLRKYFS